MLSACDGKGQADSTALYFEETGTGSDGEILGVSYYSKPDEDKTHTVLVEIPAKKDDGIKTDSNSHSESIPPKTVIQTEIVTYSDGETEIFKSYVTERATKLRPTFPPTTTKKPDRTAPTFADGTPSQTKHVPMSYKPQILTTVKAVTTAKVSHTQEKVTSAQNNSSSETVVEKAEGINVVFKSETVEKGNTASIMIQGTPGKKYSIEFYKNATDVAEYAELVEQTADKKGFVTWTFTVPTECLSGNRKIIITEKGSDKFVQTSINIK